MDKTEELAAWLIFDLFNDTFKSVIIILLIGNIVCALSVYINCKRERRTTIDREYSTFVQKCSDKATYAETAHNRANKEKRIWMMI